MPLPKVSSIPDPVRLNAEADRLLAFARNSWHSLGGYGWLDGTGQLTPARPVETWITCRMTHCFALASLRRTGGGPHSDYADYVDHGVTALRILLKDALNGGWHSAVDAAGPVGDLKEAYAHAFVVLAAASACGAGHPDGSALLDEALAVIEERFFDDNEALVVDGWNRTWTVLEDYRGINANMHTVEAFLAAAEVTGDQMWLRRALQVLERVVHGFARDHRWRLPEHYDTAWQPRLDYNLDQPDHPFRPYGVTIGHLLEWARLALHARTALGPSAPEWLFEDASALYRTAVETGWAVDGADGFVYTTDFADQPVVRLRMHWVAAEAIAAGWTMYRETGVTTYLEDYQRWWRYADAVLVDRLNGSWRHELDSKNRVSTQVWQGKPDIYHAYQATILPLLRPAGSFIGAAKDGW